MRVGQAWRCFAGDGNHRRGRSRHAPTLRRRLYALVRAATRSSRRLSGIPRRQRCHEDVPGQKRAMSLDRLADPVFRRIAEMCDSTVRTLTNSAAAISALL